MTASRGELKHFRGISPHQAHLRIGFFLATFDFSHVKILSHFELVVFKDTCQMGSLFIEENRLSQRGILASQSYFTSLL